MRRITRTSLLILIALSWTGCHSSKWYNGWCEANADCAKQAGFGKVCVLGRCQECGLNEDCKSGFRCTDLRCVPRPECETPIDCGDGRTCIAGKCVASASAVPPVRGASPGDQACPDGQVRVEGTCRSAPLPPDPCSALASVYFEKGSSSLTERSRSALAVDASCLAPGPTRALLEGHADDGESPGRSVELGLQRAEAVKRFMVGLGLHPALLSTISYGDMLRGCTEANEECRQRNRRVDVKVGGKRPKRVP